MSFSLFSLEQFITELKKPLEAADKDFVYFYRGCATHGWQYNLVPGIYRDSYIDDEDIHFREMIIKSPDEFKHEGTTLEKLVKMQHYSLPTRLLDITSNPLVALYFACGNYNGKETNGKVYVFKIKKDEIKYYDSDSVSLIANIAKLKLNKTDFTAGLGYLIHEVREEKPYYSDAFEDKNQKDVLKVFPVKVKLNNNRIVRQSGAFLIFGIKNLDSKRYGAILPPSVIVAELKIDQLAKKDILNSLNSLAINESTLFPELEHAASYLRK
jgi:hypothetical protein